MFIDPAVFFPTDARGRSQETDDRVAEAKVICHDCPVADVCLEYALRCKEPAGVWGGLTTRQRNRIRKRRAAAAIEGAE